MSNFNLDQPIDRDAVQVRMDAAYADFRANRSGVTAGTSPTAVVVQGAMLRDVEELRRGGWSAERILNHLCTEMSSNVFYEAAGPGEPLPEC